MGVVYFSIIPTFEPSRYYECWIVCFYNNNVTTNKLQAEQKPQEQICYKEAFYYV